MYFNVKTINEIIQHCDHVQKVILKVISDTSIKKYTRNILVSRVIASMRVCLTLIVSFYTMEYEVFTFFKKKHASSYT